MPTRAATSPIELQRRRKRPARVRALMVGLPVAAGLLMVANVLEVAYREINSKTTTAVAAGEAAQPRMTDPRFSGRNRDGRNYVISGREAVRDKDDQSHILIVAPVLVLSDQTGPATEMSARNGTFNERDRTLLLKGDVRVNDGTNRSLASDQALVDTRTGMVSGSSGLEAQSGASQVRSGGYEVHDQGERTIFKGGVHGRIDSKK